MYDVSGIEALADALVFNGSLNSLDLSRNNIGPEGAEALTVALTPNAAGLCNRSLDTLDVRGNAITGEAAEQLAKAVLEHPSMKVFNTIAMQDVKNDQLTQLDLRKADVGIPGVVVLSKLLVFNGSLNTVNLSWNNIGPDGAKALAVALTPNEDGVFNESLNTLNLDRNQLCGVDGDGDGTSDASGIKALANALASNKSLNTLNLADNDVGDEGEAAVQEVVKKHPNVATFNLKI
eukprot:gene4303-biopygen4236